MIFAIKPFEIHDGDGIRTTVFFKGCPLRCKWCHNPESFSSSKSIYFDGDLCKNCMKCTEICSANSVKDGKHIFDRKKCVICGKCENVCSVRALELVGEELTAKEIVSKVLKDEIFIKGSGGGVTFSGGEPLVQADLCVEIAKILKAHDINLAVDTSGYVKREALDKIIPYTDTFLFDIKAINEDIHISCTGVSNKIILENIKYVDSLGIPIEIRYPFVPTMNDGEAEKIGEFVGELKNVKRLRILPYHSYGESKYRLLGMEYGAVRVPVPLEFEIENAMKMIMKSGFDNVSSSW